MIKQLLPFILIPFLLAPAVQAETFVRITAAKKRTQKKQAGRQNLGSVQGKMKENAVYYEFKVFSVSPKISRVYAEWALFVDVMGMTAPVAYGKRDLDLKMGHSVFMNTDEVDLKELKLRGIPDVGNATIEAKIVGYGIRLLDERNQVIGEQYAGKGNDNFQANGVMGKMMARLSTPDRKENYSSVSTSKDYKETDDVGKRLDGLVKEILAKVQSQLAPGGDSGVVKPPRPPGPPGGGGKRPPFGPRP